MTNLGSKYIDEQFLSCAYPHPLKWQLSLSVFTNFNHGLQIVAYIKCLYTSLAGLLSV